MGTSKSSVSFGLHEAVEYTLAIVLFACVAHTSGATQLFCPSLGAALVVLNVASPRPLGIFRRVSYRLHHGVDLVLGGACVLSAIVWHHRLGLGGVLLAGLCAVVLLSFERTTRYGLRTSRLGDLAPFLGALGPISRRVSDGSARALGRATGQGKRRLGDWWKNAR